MAKLLESFESVKPSLATAALTQAIEPIGERYFQIANYVPPYAGGPKFVAIADTAPTLLMISQLAIRHPHLKTWGKQFVRDARAFDADTVQIDEFSDEFRVLMDEHLQIGGAGYFITTPLFSGTECAGLATHFFRRRPDNVAELKPVLNVLSQSTFDHMTHPSEAGEDAAESPLTPRQREALQLCAVGKSDWDIGVLMNVAQATAHDHIEAAKRRLGVKTRVQAVLAAYKSGWISV